MLQALLLSRDHEMIRTFRRALDAVSIEVEAVTDPDVTLSMLASKKFDAVIVDCDDVHHATDVIAKLRAGKSNKKAIVFAVSNGITTVKQAYELGANFVLDKPVNLERATRNLRAAHGLIMRERRRYHRFEVHGDATLSLSHGTRYVPLLNVSEGGISFRCDRSPEMSGQATVTFSLPGTRKAIEARIQFVPGPPTGRVGASFVAFSPNSQQAFEDWLARESEHVAIPIFINATAKR